MQFISYLLNNEAVKILIIFIVLDTIFGILRAIREKSINSAIGIDGIIRKVPVKKKPKMKMKNNRDV